MTCAPRRIPTRPSVQQAAPTGQPLRLAAVPARCQLPRAAPFACKESRCPKPGGISLGRAPPGPECAVPDDGRAGLRQPTPAVGQVPEGVWCSLSWQHVIDMLSGLGRLLRPTARAPAGVTAAAGRPSESCRPVPHRCREGITRGFGRRRRQAYQRGIPAPLTIASSAGTRMRSPKGASFPGACVLPSHSLGNVLVSSGH